MDYKNLLICLQQKNIFMTNLIDYTKQLEVKAQADSVDFEDILDKRQECMDRIDKCDALLSAILLSASSPERENVEAALSRKTTEAECDAALLPMLFEAKKYREGLVRFKELDDGVTAQTKQRYTETKEQLTKIRSNPNQQAMFQVK